MLNKRGKIGRTLGHVFVEDESGNQTDINQRMINEGYAIPFGE